MSSLSISSSVVKWEKLILRDDFASSSFFVIAYTSLDGTSDGQHDVFVEIYTS